jgi:hypothetical protein
VSQLPLCYTSHRNGDDKVRPLSLTLAFAANRHVSTRDDVRPIDRTHRIVEPHPFSHFRRLAPSANLRPGWLLWQDNNTCLMVCAKEGKARSLDEVRQPSCAQEGGAAH